MDITINKSVATGSVQAPHSKSMAHRLLICSNLAGGSKVSGLEYSEDIKTTENCLLALENGQTLYCKESGSTLRFLIPLCLTKKRKITICTGEKLMSRGLSVYEDICRQKGLYFELTRDSVTVCGGLESGKFYLRGDVSSQFISGLLFVLPTLQGNSEIILTTELESAPYVHLTLKALSLFGIEVCFENNTFKIKGGQTYKKCDVSVEGDYSNAAFFDALNYMGHNVKVTGLDIESLQGDRVYKEYFEKLKNEKATLDVSFCPDLAPVLMAVAAANNGCRLMGTRRLKIKESDRGEAMKKELEKFGVSVTVYENEIEVGCGIKPPQVILSGHNDHRIVMALAILCTVTGGEIEGAEAVNKSFPDFFERLEQLGTKVKKSET